MPPASKSTTTSGRNKKAKRSANKPAKGATASNQPSSSKRPGLRSRTATPIPTRTLERELGEERQGENSTPEDPADTDSDVGSLDTRGGGQDSFLRTRRAHDGDLR